MCAFVTFLHAFRINTLLYMGMRNSTNYSIRTFADTLSIYIYIVYFPVHYHFHREMYCLFDSIEVGTNKIVGFNSTLNTGHFGVAHFRSSDD